MAFVDNGDPNRNEPPAVYIEEITGGDLKRIEDDTMFEALYEWIEPQGFLGVFAPLQKPRTTH
jgi:hypothetical protein